MIYICRTCNSQMRDRPDLTTKPARGVPVWEHIPIYYYECENPECGEIYDTSQVWGPRDGKKD